MLAPNVHLKERYRILHKIGGGGFGYVYKAMDEVFGCSVAIKETREEVANQDKLRKAFEREAKLLRNLKHDSLPRVTDYFFQDQAQFLVMDFIEGEDLATRLKKRLQQHQGPFTCQELLPLADKILAALEYLHSRPEPIIHRDIKPSNIKLADDGEIYLLDFGLAKGVTGQMSTIVEGQPASIVPGFTREYAPLEQLQDTDTEPQSDIYALGATLYHLLTGQLPLSASRRDEALQRGQGDPLHPAHEENQAIPLAVSQIISQSLAVRWWDRIGSAKEMRAALKRACEGTVVPQPRPTVEPKTLNSHDGLSTLPFPPQREAALPDNIEVAQPAPTLTRLSRLRRSWLIAGLALVAIVGLAAVVRFAFPHWLAATDSTKPDARGTPSPENLKPTQVTTPTNLKLKLMLNGHTGTVWSVVFSPDGSLAASASEDTTIILWDTKTWTPKFPPLSGHAGAVYSIAFSPDGKTLASGSSDTTIKLWNTQTVTLIDTLPRQDDKAVIRVAFSPDGKLLASCSGNKPKQGGEVIRLWEVHNGWKPTVLEKRAIGMYALAFSPDNTLASAGKDNKQLQLFLWDINNGGQRSVLMEYEKALTTLAISADGKYMACGSDDMTIKIWLYQPQTKLKWRALAPTEAHNSFIHAIAFSPDNKTLVSASSDATIRLWDVSAQTPTLLWKSQDEIQSSSVAFSPDGKTLLTGGRDNLVRVWQ